MLIAFLLCCRRCNDCAAFCCCSTIYIIPNVIVIFEVKKKCTKIIEFNNIQRDSPGKLRSASEEEEEEGVTKLRIRQSRKKKRERNEKKDFIWTLHALTAIAWRPSTWQS